MKILILLFTLVNLAIFEEAIQDKDAVEITKDQEANKDDTEEEQEEEENVWKKGVKEEKDLAILTDENFDEFLEQYPKLFVHFYTPWCGHCKPLKKVLEEVATEFKKKSKKEETKDIDVVAFVKVNVSENPGLAEKYNITAYPDLKFFNNGRIMDYSSKFRDDDSLKHFIKSRSKYNANFIENTEDYELVLTDYISVVLLLPDEEDDNVTLYEDFALNYTKIPFAFTHNKSIVKAFDLQKKYSLMIFRKFDEGNVEISSDEMFTVDQMKEFFEKNRNPKVFEFGIEAADKIFKNESISVFLFTDNFDSDVVKSFKKVAEEYHTKYYFSLAKPSSGFGQKLAQFTGVPPSETPSLRIFHYNNQTLLKYKLKDLDEKGMKAGLRLWEKGKIKVYFNSELPPKTNNKEVLVAVGNTFKELVLDSDQHVMVMLYAAWNGYSKKLIPLYDVIADNFKNNSDISFVKMDASLNEFPGLDIKAFPSLYLYKKDDKENPIYFPHYSEKKSDKMIEFITTHTGIIPSKEDDTVDL